MLFRSERQVVLTFPLLVGLDGKEKMSKSLDNYIGIDESPEIMYEKAMKIPDNVLMDYFRLTTDIESEEAEILIKEDIVKAHKKYAEEIIRMYHGEDKIAIAEERYNKVAKGEIPTNIKERKYNGDGEINICNLLVDVNFANSKSEAKRMVLGKGVKIDGNVVENINEMLNPKEKIIQFGKNKFIKIV